MIMALATELLMVPVQPTQTHAKSGQRRHSVSVTSIEKPSPVHSVLFITKNAIKLYKVKMQKKKSHFYQFSYIIIQELFTRKIPKILVFCPLKKS